MSKKPVSVTLEQDNLLWLRSRTAAAKGRSLSDTLDRLVTAARQGGQGAVPLVRSIVGTVDISADDPGLETADEYVQQLFDRSARRPVLAKEPLARYGARRPRRRRG
ncbi:MAG: hypothetical protein ACHQO8_13275 [Vicinamibacterales bacterium]